MKREAFHYDLPPDRIAKFPLEERDRAKLLVCSRSDPSRVEHRTVRDLPDILEPGDVLVLNETRVLPNRLVGRRATGGRIECLVLEREAEECTGFLKPSKRLMPGERIEIEAGAIELTLGEALGGGRHRFRLTAVDGDLDATLARVGRAPLPPYLKREPEGEDVARDRERYQTVFARTPGAVAAPTAGLHLTDALLTSLEMAGVERVAVTLHVGEGTFDPIRSDEIEAHRMHGERFELGPAAAQKLSATRARGGRVVCVGTTSARVVETCFDRDAARFVAETGSTNLYLYPGNGPQSFDGLFTNFHLPESTLLLLVASILGRERTLALYELAIRERYRFYSFGDAMLILP